MVKCTETGFQKKNTAQMGLSRRVTNVDLHNGEVPVSMEKPPQTQTGLLRTDTPFFLYDSTPAMETLWGLCTRQSSLKQGSQFAYVSRGAERAHPYKKGLSMELMVHRWGRSSTITGAWLGWKEACSKEQRIEQALKV